MNSRGESIHLERPIPELIFLIYSGLRTSWIKNRQLNIPLPQAPTRQTTTTSSKRSLTISTLS